MKRSNVNDTDTSKENCLNNLDKLESCDLYLTQINKNSQDYCKKNL